ncbi:hypothetical protein CVS40_11681 [Lucilia cuprina]|nr:hypothetical protein CVS40_11681 [Lucilia cuprina]
MQQKNSNLTASGYINGQRKIFTVDTGVSQSIIRPLYGVSLRTATGEAATVHGKVNAKVTITNLNIVADIMDQVILGADFMIKHGIKLLIGPNVMI